MKATLIQGEEYKMKVTEPGSLSIHDHLGHCWFLVSHSDLAYELPS